MTKRLGLALGGGAALGWAHIGALKALQDAGIEADCIAGTSIGALVGACYVHDKLGPLEEIARAMDWKRMLSLTDLQIRGRGLMGGGAVVKELKQHFGDLAIEDMSKPYAAVAADLVQGAEVVFTSGLVIDAIRASISLPGVFTPVTGDEGLMVDGGLVNPLPVSAVRNLGADTVVAIDITGDYQGRARAAGLTESDEGPKRRSRARREKRRSQIRRRPLTGFANRLFAPSDKQPNLIGVLTTSASLYMRELTKSKLAASPADVHIVPKIGHITLVEFDRADELIDLGWQAVHEAVPAIKSALEQDQPRVRESV